MGMDGLELIMEVEEHFGITIKDSEVERIRTVGDLVALIRSRIVAATIVTCPTLPAFLAIRRLVRDVANDNRLRVRPRDEVIALLSPRLRRRLWRRLPELLGSAPMLLVRPL